MKKTPKYWLVLISLAWGCAASPLPPIKNIPADAWTTLQEECKQQGPVYQCSPAVLVKTYDHLVNCYYNQAEALERLDLCETTCGYDLMECKIDKQAWWRNPWITVPISILAGLAIGVGAL